MRLERVASALAIILIASPFVPTAVAVGQGDILDPNGSWIARTGVIHVRFTPTIGAGGSLITTLTLDGAVIGSDHRSNPTGNVTFAIPYEVPANMTSRSRTLVATFAESGSPSTSAWRTVNYFGGPANQAPTLEIFSATYVVGMGFRIVGRALDDEYVHRVRADAIYGGATLIGPAAMWTLDLPVNPTQLGGHDIRLVVDDGQLNATRELSVDVIGERVVLADEAVSLEPVGLHATTWTHTLPRRILEGSVTATCSPCLVTAIGGQISADDDATCAFLPSISSGSLGECRFETHDGPGTIRFVWAQHNGEMRLRVEGTRV